MQPCLGDRPRDLTRKDCYRSWQRGSWTAPVDSKMAVTEAMNAQMSPNTPQEILLQMRQRCLRAGCHYKFQWFSELIELFGDHAWRAGAFRSRIGPSQ